MRAAELFRSRFGGTPDGVWLAPGRANLMGEHTDYNDGYVLPFALGQGVTAAAARRAGRQLTLCSRQEPAAAVQIALDGLAPGQVTGWAAYPAGVAWALEAAGHPVPGACIAIDSDLPAGAGLSSSAALECATALALTELALTEQAQTELARPESAGLTVPRRELAAIARRAENEFVGVPSGIMDQSASLLCQAGHALLLDCRSLETSQVPFAPAAAGASLLLINTRAKHDLSDGEYGQRRAECEEAARRLGIPSLRSLTNPAEVDRLADPVLRRRARHVVTDNQRVLDVVALLSTPLAASGQHGPADIYRDIGRLLTRSARLAARRLRGLLAGSRRDGGGGAGRGRVRRADDGRRVRRLGARARARHRRRAGPRRGHRGVRAARLDRARVPGRGPIAECQAPDIIGVTMTPREDQVPVRDEASKLAGEIAELRHAIHREPEIGLDLPKTQAKVLDALDGLPLEISTGRALSSVTAVLRGGPSGPGRPGRSCCCAATWTRCRSPRRPGCRTRRRCPARCTPAATTCTRPCWPAPRSCSRRGRPTCPAR